MASCRGCGQEIEWVKTKAGKNMPVDPENVTVVTKEGLVINGKQPHWATCPKADRFRNQQPKSR